MTRLLLAGALVCTLTACSMIRSDRENDEIQRSFGWIGWSVPPDEARSSTSSLDQTSEITVGVYEVSEGGLVPHGWNLMSRQSRFMFLLESGVEYRLLAWQDLDENGLLDDDEAWATARAGAQLGPGSVLYSELELSHRALETEISRAAPLTSGAEDGFELVLGEVADLDAERFSSKVGEEGYWSPVTFAHSTDLGIFFVEPWDPTRIPVLFFYGAAGSIQDFRYQIDHLDRTRYQPWFLQWPTALRLEPTAESIHNLVNELHGRLGFEQLVVVAHSMGGLLARGYLVRALDRGVDYQPYLVTFSTPWEGHAAAATGVKMSPEVVPSWIDMAPGSDYQKELENSPLPGQLPSALFFGYRGGSLGPADDGTVTVSSQLARWVQREALRIEGFYESHTSILEAPEALEAMELFLAEQLALERPAESGQ